jgi:diguanylate cyclase (GGDEF)-like protein
VAAYLAVGALIGAVVASSLGARQRAAREARWQWDRDAAEREMARSSRLLAELEARYKDLAGVFVLLPDPVKQMFKGRKRDVIQVALKLVWELLEPARAAVFVASPGARRLRLADGRGLPASLARGYEVSYGTGPVGYVAEHPLAMDAADFASLSQIARRQVDAGLLREFPVDLVAPVEADGVLHAVIAVGGARRRPGEEKRLLKMVADVAGLALVHVENLQSKQEEASRDGLTGLFNKRYFNTRMGEEMQRARDTHRPLSMLILDIDHFKHYNDTNGHPEGDEVLKEVARVLRAAVREDDVVARYGGEEFVVLFPGASKALAYKQAQAIRRAIEGHGFAHAARQPLGKVTISGGVASFPEDAQSHVELIRSADQALYEAKRAGRNEIRYAEENYLT